MNRGGNRLCYFHLFECTKSVLINIHFLRSKYNDYDL